MTEFIGDLERFVAQNLYPNRLPIALLGAVALVVLVVVARRRGWLRAARAHPFGVVAALALLLIVAGPVVWYLGSPLFISTTVVETAPPAVATDAGVPTAGPATASPASERSGMFAGADDFHFGRGTARLIATAGGGWTVRFEDFAVRNGPDLYVYLSPSPKGYAKGALELGTLKADTGAFNYALPPGTDPDAYRSVVVWCKQFAVQFAHATLAP